MVRVGRGEVTNHCVLIHALNNNRGRRLHDFLGVAIDIDAIEEEGLIPGGTERLRNGASLVAPVVE